MTPLAGRTAVVTGASRGIGLATARALGAAGARVAMLARTEDALARHAGEIGAGALVVRCDLTRRDDVVAAATGVRAAFGGAPDILVNNAGAFELAPLHETSESMFESTIDVNLVSPFLLLRAFLAEMRTRASGHVVTVGSIADRMVFPANGAYAASKFAARAMHEVLRAELRGTGVRATLVSPGPVDTALWDEVDPDAREGFTPRAAMLAAAAVADAIVYALTRAPEVNVDELRLSRS